jgi:putative ABC transport system permease protein
MPQRPTILANLGKRRISVIFGVVRSIFAEGPTLEQLLDERTAARRFNTWLLSVFAAAAVALTAIGLYSLVAYLVVLRRHEMAVRLAIGATPRHVLALVVRNIAVIVGAGLMLGLAGLAAVAPWLHRLLFEIQPADPLSQAGVLLVLLTVAFVAAWIPARRAKLYP